MEKRRSGEDDDDAALSLKQTDAIETVLLNPFGPRTDLELPDQLR